MWWRRRWRAVPTVVVGGLCGAEGLTVLVVAVARKVEALAALATSTTEFAALARAPVAVGVVLVRIAPRLARLELRVVCVRRLAPTKIASAALAHRAMVPTIRRVTEVLAHLLADVVFDARVACRLHDSLRRCGSERGGFAEAAAFALAHVTMGLSKVIRAERLARLVGEVVG